MNRFDYLKPVDIKEACTILADKGSKAKPLAGGTDLLVRWRKGKVCPEYLVDLKGLGLEGVSVSKDGGISIGALSTLNSLLDSEYICRNYPFLTEILDDMGSVQIRNRATIGGNICNASSTSDLAPILLALGAKSKALALDGERELKLENFFLSPGKTVLAENEILADIQLPPFSKKSGAVYLKMKRNAMDLALAGVAVFLTLQDEDTCAAAKIVLGAVSPTPVIATQASDALVSAKIDEKNIEKAADLAEKAVTLVKKEVRPIDNVRASSWYRQDVIKSLTAQAIEIAYKRALQSIKK